MPKYNKYRPNYLKLYPCLEDRPDVLEVLKKGDRKMEYAEVDLKQETFVCDQEKQIAKFIPSREDSYERLQENDCQQFSAENVSVEDSVVLSDQISRLHIALEQLEDTDRQIIEAIYFEGLTERQLGERLNLHYMTIHNRKVRILRILKKHLKK